MSNKLKTIARLERLRDARLGTSEGHKVLNERQRALLTEAIEQLGELTRNKSEFEQAMEERAKHYKDERDTAQAEVERQKARLIRLRDEAQSREARETDELERAYWHGRHSAFVDALEAALQTPTGEREDTGPAVSTCTGVGQPGYGPGDDEPGSGSARQGVCPNCKSCDPALQLLDSHDSMRVESVRIERVNAEHRCRHSFHDTPTPEQRGFQVDPPTVERLEQDAESDDLPLVHGSESGPVGEERVTLARRFEAGERRWQQVFPQEEPKAHDEVREAVLLPVSTQENEKDE